MTVNTVKRSAVLIALILLSLTGSGCFNKGRTPYVSFISASSRLNSSGTSNRVDVVVDLRNGRNETYKDLSLTISFADSREVTFKWPELKPFGYIGAEEAVEVVSGISSSTMLGGTFETLSDDRDGATYVYATEISGALFSYKDSSDNMYKKDIGNEVNNIIRESFNSISLEDGKRQKLLRLRIEKLKKQARIKSNVK